MKILTWVIWSRCRLALFSFYRYGCSASMWQSKVIPMSVHSASPYGNTGVVCTLPTTKCVKGAPLPKGAGIRTKPKQLCFEVEIKKKKLQFKEGPICGKFPI